MHEIIFEADTSLGKFFDIGLLIAIILSVIAVMLESVHDISLRFGTELHIIEWFFTVLFTIEYVLRIISTGKPFKYILSFYGIVDFLATIPTYLGIFFTGTQSLLIIRIIRLIRVFRIFKLARYVGGAQMLIRSLRTSRPKIIVFLMVVLVIATVIGTLMYLIEGGENGFTSIPRSIYWAIVTLTTVGYGDIAPVTVLGEMLASVLMIMGYGIIAVPTGIVGAEMASTTKIRKEDINTHSCPQCSKEGHDNNAKHCKFCGSKLHP
ncbi:MAG: ion transporter [Bacteroidia bacterium]|nr:ion transporter [Bacteroidia bacterium]